MIGSAAIGRSKTPRKRAGWACGLVVALTVLALATGVRGATASTDAWANLRVPGRVAAGQTITLELPSAPRKVEEMEILLSLDDGRTFPVRVTREIAAGEREIRWKVPAFATASARLRIRFGEGARETWGPMSEPFTIVTDGSRPELHLFHENGWWEGLDPAPAGDAAGELGSGGVTLVAGHSFEPLALPPTSPASSGRAPARPIETLASSAPEAPIASDRSKLRERFFPLRN